MRKSLTLSDLSAAIAATLLLGHATSAAPVVYNGGVYGQNFDGLPRSPDYVSQTLTGRGPHELTGLTGATNIDGWFGSNYAGTSANTEFRAQDGSLSGGTGRGVVSFGTNGSNERALGTLATSNQISRFGVILVNNTTDTYTSFDLSFITEQWRRGDVAAPGDIAAFSYALNPADINDNALFTNVPAFDAISVNNQVAPDPINIALDGNALVNQDAVAGTLSGIVWAPGATLALRWTSPDLTGQDNGIAIDSVSFSASVPEPVAGLALLVLPLIARKRRRSM